MKNTIRIRITRQDNTPMGEWNGGYMFHAETADIESSWHFRGCPLGRGATEAGALTDFVRRAAGECDFHLTTSNLEVVERRDHAFRSLAKEGTKS